MQSNSLKFKTEHCKTKQPALAFTSYTVSTLVVLLKQCAKLYNHNIIIYVLVYNNYIMLYYIARP